MKPSSFASHVAEYLSHPFVGEEARKEIYAALRDRHLTLKAVRKNLAKADIPEGQETEVDRKIKMYNGPEGLLALFMSEEDEEEHAKKEGKDIRQIDLVDLVTDAERVADQREAQQMLEASLSDLAKVRQYPDGPPDGTEVTMNVTLDERPVPDVPSSGHWMDKVPAGEGEKPVSFDVVRSEGEVHALRLHDDGAPATVGDIDGAVKLVMNNGPADVFEEPLRKALVRLTHDEIMMVIGFYVAVEDVDVSARSKMIPPEPVTRVLRDVSPGYAMMWMNRDVNYRASAMEKAPEPKPKKKHARKTDAEAAKERLAEPGESESWDELKLRIPGDEPVSNLTPFAE